MKETIFQIYLYAYYIVSVFFLIYWYFENRKRFFYLSMITFLIPLLGLYLAFAIMFFDKKRKQEKEESRFDSFEIEDILKQTTTEIEFERYHRMMEKPVIYDDIGFNNYDAAMTVGIQQDIINRLAEAKTQYSAGKSLENAIGYVKVLSEYIDCGLFEGKAVDANFEICDEIVTRLIADGMTSPEIYEQKIRNLISKNDFKNALKTIDVLQISDPYNEHIIYFKMKIFACEDSERFTRYIEDLYNDPATINSNYYGLVMFFAT